MKICKLSGKIIVYFFLFLVSVIVLYLVIAVILTLIPVNTSFKESKQGVEIFITSNGVHTNICLPVKYKSTDWSKFIQFKDFKIDSLRYNYISFGWGDREFYLNTPQWKDIKFSTAFKALFYKQPSVLHVLYYNFKPEKGKYVKSLQISDEQYQIICEFVRIKFKTQDNKILKINYAGFLNENFYESNGSYSSFYTCNNWCSHALKTAGIKTSLWTPFAQCVFYQLP